MSNKQDEKPVRSNFQYAPRLSGQEDFHIMHRPTEEEWSRAWKCLKGEHEAIPDARTSAGDCCQHCRCLFMERP